MTTDTSSLIERALEVQQRLELQGAVEDARVIEQLVNEVRSAQPGTAQTETPKERSYYTVTEAADLVGVSGQTIKNWVSRGMIQGYRLGGRIVIPRSELDDFRPLAEASKALDPTPSRDEIVEAIRAGRRPFVWPVEPTESKDSES